MKTRRLLKLVLTLTLLLVLQAALLPGDGDAHDSAYCGHGEDGYTIATRWIADGNDASGHWHQYEHLRWAAWRVHEPVWQICNGTH